jgi:hypothetical protein
MSADESGSGDQNIHGKSSDNEIDASLGAPNRSVKHVKLVFYGETIILGEGSKRPWESKLGNSL